MNTPPRRPRAIAIPVDPQDRWLMFIHAILALLAPLLIFALVGCEEQAEGIPVDYGPEIPFDQVREAIINGVEGIDPADVKEGAAVQYTTTQYIAGGRVVNLLSVTTLSIRKREPVTLEDGQKAVILTIHEKRTPLTSGEQGQDVEREFRKVFADDPASSFAVEGSDAPLALSKPVVSPLATKVSFHKLQTKVTRGAPPAPVVQRPDCRGLPGCTMTYNHVSFDQVSWTGEGPEKIHFDFEVSPDVPQISGFNMSPLFPFYQGLTKSCVTLLVGVGEGREKVLLMECQEVQDFRLESPTQ